MNSIFDTAQKYKSEGMEVGSIIEKIKADFYYTLPESFLSRIREDLNCYRICERCGRGQVLRDGQCLQCGAEHENRHYIKPISGIEINTRSHSHGR